MTASDRFVSVAVAGSLSGVTDRTIRRWIASGRLPVVSGPRGRLVDLEDVRRLAALSGHAPAPDPVNVQIVTGSPDPTRIHVRTEPDLDRTDDPDGALNGGTVSPFSAEGLDSLVALVRDQQQTILELSGRCGWLQAQLQAAHEQIALLEAPKEQSIPQAGESIPQGIHLSDPATTSTAHRSAPEQNGPNSASYERESRPWWRRWLSW